MVFHDWELDRLTGESGPVAGADAAELARIALRGSDETHPDACATCSSWSPGGCRC